MVWLCLTQLYTATMVINMAYHRIEIPLCEARHEITTKEGKKLEGGIFPQVVENPMDFIGLEAEVHSFINAFKRACGFEEGDTIVIDLYVTGLTPCLVAYINSLAMFNFCKINIQSNLYHYNRESGGYEKQTLITERREVY